MSLGGQTVWVSILVLLLTSSVTSSLWAFFIFQMKNNVCCLERLL